MARRIRVLVGKPGLDGHDRGAKVVAAALRDAGMEVVYTGLHQSSDQIVEAAVQEDVDVVALSILSGAHMTLFPEVLAKMKERGIGDRLLTGGGIIPPEDMATLAAQGVGRLFGPGTSTREIASYIHATLSERYGEDALAPLTEPPALRATELVTAAEIAHHARPTPARAAAARPTASRATSARPTPARATPARARASAPKKNGTKPKKVVKTRGAAPARVKRVTTKRAAAKPTRPAKAAKKKSRRPARALSPPRGRRRVR